MCLGCEHWYETAASKCKFTVYEVLCPYTRTSYTRKEASRKCVLSFNLLVLCLVFDLHIKFRTHFSFFCWINLIEWLTARLACWSGKPVKSTCLLGEISDPLWVVDISVSLTCSALLLRLDLRMRVRKARGLRRTLMTEQSRATNKWRVRGYTLRTSSWNLSTTSERARGREIKP